MICKICGNNSNNKILNIPEMMLGLQETFDYSECSQCGCLQLVSIPKNLEKYYPNEKYYSFKKFELNLIERFFRKKRNEYILKKKSFIGKIVQLKHANYYMELISKLNLNKNSGILDVGCGTGNFIVSLGEIGFNNIMGIDPYINNDIFAENYKILKKSIYEIPEDYKFELIIFSHSLEHILDQQETLSKAVSLLSDNGALLIGMPVKNEYIWNTYGINWVQIDAPRHFLVHTKKSFKMLIKELDLIIKEIIYDSNEFQFVGSEKIKNKIPLNSNEIPSNLKKTIFSHEKIKEFKKRAINLNKNNSGDQAIFLIKKNRKNLNLIQTTRKF